MTAESSIPARVLPTPPAPAACGKPGKKGPCRRLRKTVQYSPNGWLDAYSTLYWQLSGCCEPHLDESDRAILLLLEEIEERNRRVAKYVVRARDLAAELAVVQAAEEMRDEEAARERVAADPACWAWFGLPGIPGPTDLATLEEWQAGRCAVCGKVTPLVRDHDHWSGLIRGLLCWQCNREEGGGYDFSGPFAAYRQLHPARYYQLRIPYPNQTLDRSSWGLQQMIRSRYPLPPESPGDLPGRDPAAALWGDENPGVAIRKAANERRG